MGKMGYNNYKILGFYRLMRKTTVPCACGCKHFKGVGSIPNSLNSFGFEYTLR